MLLSSLGISSPNVALPTFVTVFAAPFQEVQWIVVSYLLAITIMIVSVGRLGDLFGHRRILLCGIALFTLASLLCGLAPTLPMLIGARVLQGIGAAILMALTMALVRESVPKEKTGSAMGLLGTMSAIGTALGPSVGGVLVARFGWQSIFWIMAPLGVVNFVMVRRFLPVQRLQASMSGAKRFDSVGTVLLAVTLACYTLGVTLGGGHFERLNRELLMAAAACAVVFLLVESRLAAPLIKLSVFRNPVLGASLAMNALISTVMMTTLVVVPFFLSRGLGLEAALIGVVMATGPVISIFCGVPAGKIVDRVGAPTIIVTALVQMSIGAFALSALPAMIGIAGYVIAIVILTPGYQLFQASNNTVVMIDVPADQRGVISGMLTLSRNLGLVTGASVMGILFSHAVGSADPTTASPGAVIAGMRLTFTVAGVLLLIALSLALLCRGSLIAAMRRTATAK